ncbi:hypothetical protein RI129_003820 [Pyrocoelia pectoralis]|uniref:FXNA-like protease n=1 Tax=Pyrocoelia pectoralis TaxID=417401 RepID=A0AAN7VSZ5_9COLE
MRKRVTTQNESSNETLLGEDYTSNKHRSGVHNVPFSFAILLLIALFALFGFVHLLDGRLPTALTIHDEKNYPDAFITDRAKHDLKLLTSLGSRVTGSYENEVLAVSFFQREIAFIQQQARRNQKIEIDIQKVSGAFYNDFRPHGAINTYSQIQNVVVKLHGSDASKHSLLLNSHFDTVPSSPGGTDAGINCVVMLEILRKLSRSPYRLRHNVIFLFNGAEETGLRASHGFITQHKWAKEIKTLINLEGAGAGGKELLFQTGIAVPWILRYYKNVPHPRGQVFSEEIFQTGQIPSDTDFRIFRDYGNVTGIDFAFTENGYRYHTKYDDFENIPDGSYQHIGDNVLTLTKLLGNATEMDDPNEFVQHKTVFFDIFGFFITYTENQATLINSFISLLSILVTVWSFYKFGLGITQQSAACIGLTSLAFITGWSLAGFFTIVTATFLDLLKSSLSWYGSQWMLLGLYTLPTIACCCTSVIVLNNYNEKMNLNVNVQSQIQIHVVKLLWTFALLIGTFLKIRSVYLIMMPVLFQTVACLILHLLQLQHSVRKWQVVYLITLIIPTVFLMNVLGLAGRVLIPMCGRIGPERNPELIMGILTFAFTLLLSSLYVPLITLVHKPGKVVKILFTVFILFVLIALSPLGFPYNGNSNSPTLQRYWIFHTSRTFRNDTNHVYKKNAGFFVINWDRNAPNTVRQLVKDFNKEKSITEDCDNNLLCGLPLISSKIISVIRDSTWIPAGQPIVHEQINFKMVEKNQLSSTVRQFNFSLTGPSHMHITISPRINATLIKNNLVPHVPKTLIWNNRKIYIILHVSGAEVTPLSISLNFQVPANWEGPTFDIGISGKCVHDRTNLKTPQYVKFLSSFPEWADVVPHLATYETWVY